MKRVLTIAAAGVLAGLICLAWGWRQWTGSGPAAPGDAGAVVLRIPAGMTLGAAADTLVARGLLRDRRVLLAGARLSGQDRGLRAGLYELAWGQSPRDLLADLTAGRSVQVVFTVPEGLECPQVAAIIGPVMGFTPERFLTVADSLSRQAVAERGLLGSAAAVAAHDSLLAAATAAATGGEFHWCEGLLAPDTYRFAAGSGPEVVAGHLLATQLERLDQAHQSARGGSNADLAPWELLSLAALVESEARRDDERALVAAVYSNRLRKGWRLEADPTVAYVLAKRGERLFFKDLKVDSPYNTYLNRGLPPGPINAPGLASLLAAARPDSACTALYFVSDGEDGHVFSRTAREHDAAVERFRALRSQSRRTHGR